ncbi:MAG: iron ABC transporter permease [Alphaproteobacteria bacterium]|nr:iron ABC transporter permease [Alphaproteobacteria bacterium]
MSVPDMVNPQQSLSSQWVRRAAPPYWTALSAAIFLLIISPIVGLVLTALTSSAESWPHLVHTILPKALRDTALLMIGVSALSILAGAGTAWLITLYRFPGRRIFKWLLVVPLAMPTYLAAFCYVEVWDYSGWVQTALRSTFGFTNARDYWFPDIRSLGGAVFVMSSVLFPYVYLTARASFLAQSANVLEASRTLGCSPWLSFWKVGLPLARPAIAAGTALVMMECLNDIGAVEHFGVNTLTITVYDTWLERGSLGGAAQIACAMLIAVIFLFALERWSRRQQQFYQLSGKQTKLPTARLTSWKAALAFIACFMPFLLGFGVPGLFLVDASLSHASDALQGSFWTNAFNSFMLASFAAGIAMFLGLLMVFTRRLRNSTLMNAMAIGASIGYAVPGTVLAIGVLITLAAVERVVGGLTETMFGITTGLLVSGTSAAIVFAYVVRFFTISQGTLDAGMAKLSPHLDDAARSLGRTPSGVLKDVHLPLLRPALGVGVLLVFVDSMKELPATLLLRPFNFDTLATQVYTLASLDLFEEAAPAALAIVIIGLIPLMLLNHVISTGRRAVPKR